MHDTALLVTVFAVVGLVGLNALSYYSMKRLVLPNVVWVLLIGVIYGALARFTNLGFPRIGLKPDLILWLFVPLLIFSSTQKICLSHLRRVLLPASLAATIGVLISMLVIAGALHFGFQIGWLEALLFGAILSATDPLAIGALLDGNSRVSESQRLLIEGESILNDGFVVTVAGTIGTLLFTGGKFDLTESIMYFEIEVLGALLTGLILGRGARGVLVAPQLE
jgi:CPA1 family monovalent cation:H+ antiporter